MKQLLYPVALLLLLAGALNAQPRPLTVFEEANRLYEQGHYARAIELYESLLPLGRGNAVLHYNLGNACYRTQAIGKAILHFERAKRRSPRDADIRHNLAFLRQSVNEPAPSLFESAAEALDGLLSLNELTALCSIVFLFFTAGLVFYLLRRTRLLLATAFATGFLVLTFAGWLALKIHREVVIRTAIVMAGPMEIRNGPGPENSVGFTLPEGRKLVLLGEKDEWAAIALPVEGLKGWVEKKYLEEL